jgi:maltooligosyltrehalose trehalohydrolase
VTLRREAAIAITPLARSWHLVTHMPEIRIWAPTATTIEVVLGDQRRLAAMREPGGWWRVSAVREGQDYLVSTDGGAAWPDPRSRWQPEGVHGPTRCLDPSRQLGVLDAQLTAVPLREALIYELHIGTFTEEGTFASAIPRLEHLVALGVTHVELMPIAQFPGRHGWGYDGVDLFAAHQAYGGPSGLHALVRACHARGLAVIVDVVLNHFGPEGAYANRFGRYTTSGEATPWGEAINLDGEGALEVRRFFLDSALAWLRDYAADGLRLDAIHAMRDRSTRHLVAELVDEVRALERETGRKYTLIGEYDDHDPIAVRERARGGWGLDAHWNDDFHHAVHAMLTGERQLYYADFAAPDTLAKVLEHGYALDGGYSRYRRHDHGKPYGELPRDRLVGYVQSHDQIGNRGHGERLSHLCGLAGAKIAAALLFTSPFVPMIFAGEECAASTPFYYFADLQSPELRAAITEGRRREHGGTGSSVDPLAAATRDASVLRWSELAEPAHAAMLDWYRRLIALRRATPVLRDSAPRSTRVAGAADGVLVIERGDVVICCNLDERAHRIQLDDVLLATEGLASARELPPRACAIGRRTA